MEFHQQPINGLCDSEVKARIESGLVNRQIANKSQSTKAIIRNNVLTFFNLINLILFVALILVGSFKNGFFMGVVIVNTAIGIYQQLKAKKELDQLRLLGTNKVAVIRQGNKEFVMPDKLVMDDRIILERGSQVPADCKIEVGQCEVNESLLTGESDSVDRNEGEDLLAGSYLTGGEVVCKITKVGEDNFASKIVASGQTVKKDSSELKHSLNKVLKVISIIIVPLAVGFFIRLILIEKISFKEAIIDIAGSMVGMIPAGLMLLTSVSLALSCLRLAKKKTLVQDYYSIESLARTDVICLDKTGTLTQGKLKVQEVIKLTDDPIEEIMGNILAGMGEHNVTYDALSEYFALKKDYTVEKIFSFSSAKKYGGVQFKEGTYYIGALEFLVPRAKPEIVQRSKQKAAEGYRVISLVRKDKNDPEVLALIVLSDILRPRVSKTLSYFTNTGVKIKIISGDDPLTVLAISKKAGVPDCDKYCDLSKVKKEKEIEKLASTMTIFGRVSPSQKASLIKGLKKAGMHPAMVGDGVNDIPALKQANCGIALGSGSDATKHAADIILLNNDFDSVPSIVLEGRRVINNITKASSIFLVKTIFSVILGIITIFTGLSYPFEPIQLTVISGFMVGIPTFLLAYEANFQPINKHYFQTVMSYSLPGALSISTEIVLLELVGKWLAIPSAQLVTIMVIVTGINYLLTLVKVYAPLNTYRSIIIFGLQIIYYLVVFNFQSILGLQFSANFVVIVIYIVSIVAAWYLQKGLRKIYSYFSD